MSKTYRLGAIGFAHMHINSLLSRFDELPSSGVADVEWVACADTIPAVPSYTCPNEKSTVESITPIKELSVISSMRTSKYPRKIISSAKATTKTSRPPQKICHTP